MARRSSTFLELVVMLAAGLLTLGIAGAARAATPTYYADQMMFQGDITNTVTDDYSNPGYVFNQGNAQMSAVLGETDYMSTGHNNLNLVVNMGVDPRYCSGCNGSFLLSFQTTSVGNAVGVNGVGLTIDAGTDYFALITFGDGTTADIMLPGSGNFWGVAAPERIESIHFGLSGGGTTTNGYIEIDDLIVGDGNIGGCMMDADCFDNGDPCTDPFCNGGMCDFMPNNAACDDGDICTEMDTCAMGICSGSPVSCDDGNECTDEFCDPGAGCIIQLNSEPCDDGDVCTEMDMCAAGMCTGTMIDCNDDDVCSMDSCDPMMGCVNEPQPDCCESDEDCGEEETCDLDTNSCEPVATGSSTGDADTGSPDTGGSGADDTAGDSGSGGGSGAPDTGSPDTGSVGSTSGIGGSGTTDPGELPPPDFNTCECRANPAPQGRLWWLMVVLGVVARRRRGRPSA